MAGAFRSILVFGGVFLLQVVGAATTRVGTAASAQVGAKALAPDDFSGSYASAAMSDQQASKLLDGFGLEHADFADGRSVKNSVGFIVFDRAVRRIVASYNPDAAFNLASTTKLFTVAAVGMEFKGDPFLAQHRGELEDMLRVSENRVASTWLFLARDHSLGKPTDYAGWKSRVRGECYGDPPRDAVQQITERDAAKALFKIHRASYAIDWHNAEIVDGAGCERGLWPGGADRMTPRQYLTLLDSLRQRDFGGWNAFRLLPQKRFDGTPLPQKSDGRYPGPGQVYAWKTGGDKTGIRNIAGYIPGRGDPFAYYFVLLVNTGRSPPGQIGLRNGAKVLNRFAAWAAQIADQAPASK